MTAQTTPRFETKRLIVRWLTAADATDLFEVYASLEAMVFWGKPPMQSMVEAEKMIQDATGEFSETSSLRLAIEHKSSGRLIGTCSLFNIRPVCRRAEIGYILSPKFWRQGLMSEALDALLVYAFETRNFNRLEADIDPRNIASAKSLERLGFQQEGLLRERWIVDGEVSDSALYGLLQREWRMNHA